MRLSQSSLAAHCEPPGQPAAFITVVSWISPGIRYQRGLLVPDTPCCALGWRVFEFFLGLDLPFSLVEGLLVCPDLLISRVILPESNSGFLLCLLLTTILSCQLKNSMSI